MWVVIAIYTFNIYILHINFNLGENDVIVTMQRIIFLNQNIIF
jgi:hypothetical protein